MAYQQQFSAPIFGQMEVDQFDVGAVLGRIEQQQPAYGRQIVNPAHGNSHSQHMGQSSFQENGNGFQAPVVGTHQFRYPNGAVQRKFPVPVAPMHNQGPVNFGTLQPPMMCNQMYGNMGISQFPMMGSQMHGNMGTIQSPMMDNQMHGNLGISQAPMMGNGQGPFTNTSQPDFMAANQAAFANNYDSFPMEGIMAEFADVDMEYGQGKQRPVMSSNHAPFMNNMQFSSVGNVQTPAMNGMQMNGVGGIRTPAVNGSNASQQKMSTLSPTAPAFIPNQVNMRQQSAAPSMGEPMQIQTHKSSRRHTKKNKRPQKNMQSHQHEPLTTSTDRSLQIKRQAQFQQAQMLQHASHSQCSQSSAGAKAKQPDKKQAKKGSEPHFRAPGTQSTPIHTPETMRSTSIEAIFGMTNTSLITEMSRESNQNDLLESVVKNGKAKRAVPQQPTQQSAKRSSAHAFVGQNPEPIEVNKAKLKPAAKKRIVREQYVINAKTNGEPIPPSRRRMVVLDPADPRCIIKDGVTTAPAPDGYNGTTSHDPLSRLPKLTGPIVYTMGPPFTPNELNQMVSDLVGTNQTKKPAPPSENVTSKRRKSSMVQAVARDAAAFHASSTAQSVPDNSATTRSASPDTIPSLTPDGGSNTQSSPLEENLSHTDGTDLQSLVHEAAGVNYYGDQPTVATNHAEIASLPEPVKGTNNSVNTVSTLFSDEIVCPYTNIDLSPLMDLGPVFQHDVSTTAPAQQDTQLEIDPTLTYLVAEDNSHASIADPKATKDQAVQAATPLPKTASVGGCAPQEQANVSQQSLTTESYVSPQEHQTRKVSSELDRGSGEQSVVSVPEAVSEEVVDDEHTALIDLYKSGVPLVQYEVDALINLKKHYPFIDIGTVLSRNPVPDGNVFADDPWFLEEASPNNFGDEFGTADPEANSNDGISYATGEEEDNPFSQPSAIPGFNVARHCEMIPQSRVILVLLPTSLNQSLGSNPMTLTNTEGVIEIPRNNNAEEQATTMTATGASKRKSGDDVHVAPSKKVCTGENPASQLALP
ncbi:hypothetical protein FHETE_5634 [Fusarium heterosporum]|uniref:Uncharacterized protein n=1 Tax=Fusarium heterosporum TaxID=42747 RepID=A0A8H5WPP4_FUSHE|nr:hypothetical protein FHETE_5634 [Fusarium heterosporum]